MKRVTSSRPRRGGLILWALLGVLAGLGIALYLTWVIWPAKYTNTDPSDLLPERKALWAELASDGYALTGNLEAARQRLAALGIPDAGVYVAQVAEARLQAGGANLEHIRAMARLSEALGGITARLLVYIATPAPTSTPTPEPTQTPTATPTARPSPTANRQPTSTATPTQPSVSQVFRLSSKESRCAAGKGPDVIAVFIQDGGGRGMPGLRIEVSWAGGSEAFYTGLKPYVDPGFADFAMEPDVDYVVTVGVEGSDIAKGIRSIKAECPEITGPSHHEWVLHFKRTRP